MDQPKSNGEQNLRKQSLIVFVVFFAIITALPYLIASIPEERQQPIAILSRVLTYLLTAVLIWMERSDLLSFNIDKASVWVFLLGRTLLTFVMLLFYNMGKDAIFLWGAFLVYVYIAITLWRALPRKFLHNNGWKPLLIWTGFGFLSSTLIAAALIALAYWGLKTKSFQSPWLEALMHYTYGLIQSLCNPALTEEPIFRGFLWGYLKKMGLRDGWVLLITSGLFVISHPTFFMTKWLISLLLISPFVLLLGFLVWRSRSLVPSMIAHMAYNAAWYVVK